MKRTANDKVQHHHHHRHRSQQQQRLSKGSLVEVTSDDEGFKGAWFVATVLDSPSTPSKPSTKKKNPNYDKVYVEYQTLISEEDSSLPLREYVNVAFVRPVPPEETHPKPFELGDVVDAYYSDGWWTGVITRLVKASRFVVTFQNPPDEIEFGFSDLRFHREWVNGNWLRPVNRKAAGVMFSVGKKVEISFDREGHQESWFPATVLEETGNGIFRTEYQIQDRSGRVGHLKAIVDSLHIRPCPPHLKDKNFFFLEKVDAFYDCGWRSGVITKELAESRYIVFFKQSNKEKEFSHSELRPHMEWKDGKWFTSSQDVLIPSDYQKHEAHLCNSANKSDTALSLGSSGSTKSISEGKLLFSPNSGENQVELSTPCNEKPSGIAADFPSDFVGKEKSIKEIPATLPSPTASPISTNTIEAPIEEKISIVVSPRSENVGNNFLKQPLSGDQSSDSHSWGKRVKRKRMKFGELEDSPMLGVRNTNDGFTEVPIEKAQTSVEGKEGYAEGAAADVQKECMTIKTNLPVVLGLACDMMRCSRTKRTCQSSGEESLKHTGDWAGLDDTGLHSVKVIDQFELGEKTQKKRRGRPPKSAMKSSILSMPEEPSKSVAVDELFVKDCITSENDSLAIVEVATSMDTLDFGQECLTNGGGKKLMNNQIKQKHKPGIVSMSPARMPSEERAEDSIKQHERHSMKRGRKRMINLNSVSQVHDSSNATEQKQVDSNSVRKESGMVTKESSNNMSDDQPLSKWFEEMHSPTTNDGSISPPRNTEKCAEASSEQLEIVKETPAIDNRNGTAGSELQCLPFLKNTILWSTIESMEVFQKMPQKPHFCPLEQCKESSREGLAIGCMVMFSSVVERTSRLQFDDHKSTMDDILETLAELESHGFDVQVVRDRVNALLSGKEKQKNLQSQIEQLDSEIGKHSLEKTKIDEEMDEINRQIKVLQEKLSEVMSKKENKDREIISLQSRVEGIKEGIRRVQCDFEGLATLL